MNIVFRVDSSIHMGVGHLMRCLTLADALKKQNHKIAFICRELAGNLIQSTKQKHTVVTLPNAENFQSDHFYLSWLGATQENDAQQTIEHLPKNTDLLVIDSYALDEKWHQKLRPFVKKIMVIDDLANRKLDCDILLNQNLGSTQQDYQNKVPNNCQLLLGSEYALLRPEFSELREQALDKRKNTKAIKNILISMGGSDLKNITYDTLEVLQQMGGDFNITVVLGGSSPHNQMIKNYAKANKNIEVVINAHNMAKLILEADLSIGAGGSTSWERCCLGLPTLLFITADNQREIAQNLENTGAVKIVDSLKEDIQKIVNIFSLWQNASNQAKYICDGLGVKKVIKLCQY